MGVDAIFIAGTCHTICRKKNEFSFKIIVSTYQNCLSETFKNISKHTIKKLQKMGFRICPVQLQESFSTEWYIVKEISKFLVMSLRFKLSKSYGVLILLFTYWRFSLQLRLACSRAISEAQRGWGERRQGDAEKQLHQMHHFHWS